MNFSFYKYQGTGNDFILIDNREGSVRLSTAEIAGICDRHFGVGADGLMLLENLPGYDFRMVYYNSDGKESSMCGNGGRCITAFAKRLGIISDKARFLAIDGDHSAAIHSDETISLFMQDVTKIIHKDRHVLLDTGSPHYVTWVDDVDAIDVRNAGRTIRNADEFMPDGINVNFVQKLNDGLYVRTYERGVEDETLSCGTGVTACAIAASGMGLGPLSTKIYTPGGVLEVSFMKDTEQTARQVILKGPASFVFEGSYDTSIIR